MSRVENPPMFMPFAKYRIQFVIVIAYLDSNGREQHRKGIGTEPSFKKFRQCQQAIALQQRSPLYFVPLTTSKMIKGNCSLQTDACCDRTFKDYNDYCPQF